jgi:hypothetical protein
MWKDEIKKLMIKVKKNKWLKKDTITIHNIFSQVLWNGHMIYLNLF